ncbi:hypothetical protein LCGC14_1160530 [marine sediment metagenome]|uniref:Uncharacterized protein n=1 Tax=marine sediment metagenome TaxID=412755 RepID=A0A0F9MFQ9_9ZZZZ
MRLRRRREEKIEHHDPDSMGSGFDPEEYSYVMSALERSADQMINDPQNRAAPGEPGHVDYVMVFDDLLKDWGNSNGGLPLYQRGKSATRLIAQEIDSLKNRIAILEARGGAS